MRNLRIFDSSGSLIESSFIFFEKVSTYLFSIFEIHIMEEVFSLVENRLAFRTPIQESPDIESLVIQTRNDNSKFFIVSPSDTILSKDKTKNLTLDSSSFTLSIDGFKETSSQEKTPLSLFLVFSTEMDENYSDFLDFYEVNSSGDKTLFFSMQMFATSEADSEKYVKLLKRFGQSISSSDYAAFAESNSSEPFHDSMFLNQKRKELLLVLPEILPFIGSYRSLVPILNFFGHNNLRLKEYWKNIDTTSPDFGSLKAVEIQNIFSKNSSLNDSSRIKASKIYRKSNKWGLFFDIIVETNTIDDEGLPEVEEVYSFSFQEVFLKMVALKRKLEKDFLSLSNIIIDIVGEAIYFGKLGSKNWNHLSKIVSYSVNINPSCEIYPSNKVYVEDLRPLSELGCPIGHDMSLTNVSNLLHHRCNVVQQGDSRLLSRYKLTITAGLLTESVEIQLNTIQGREKYIFTTSEIAQLLVDACKASTSTLFKNHRFFVEPGTSTIRIVQKVVYGVEIVVDEYEDVNLGLTTWADVSFPYGLNIDTSPGSSYFGPSGAPMSYYYSAFLFSFESADLWSGLVDSPGIPIGASVILKNTSFDILLEDLDDVSFLDFDAFREDTPIKKKFEGYSTSFTITGFTALGSEVTPPFPISNYLNGPAQTVVTPISDFPYEQYPYSEGLTFDDAIIGDFYEAEWNIFHDNSSWIHNSGRISIETSKNYPLILPYSGTYSVELILHSADGSFSRKYTQSAIEVKLRNSNFLAWKRFAPRDLDISHYMTQRVQSKEVFTEDERPLMIEELYSLVENPLPPNEAIELFDCSFQCFDSIEFFQGNPRIFPLDARVSPSSYIIDNLRNVKIEDLYHIWMDAASPILCCTEYLSLPDNGILLGFRLTEKIAILDSGISITLVADETAALSYSGLVDIWLIAKDSRKAYFYDFSASTVIKTHYRVDYLDLGDLTLLSQYDRMIEMMKAYAFVDSNSFVFNEYLATLEFRENSGIYDPFVKLVSKGISYVNRHYFSGGTLSSSGVYELSTYGAVGDLDASWDIYTVDPLASRKITIGDNQPYLPSSTTLVTLASELNASNAPGINRYSYNVIYDLLLNDMKIVAVRKSGEEIEEERITFEGIVGSTFSRSFYTNPRPYEARLIAYSDDHPIGSLLHFNCENSKISGKTKVIWKIIKESSTGIPEWIIEVENFLMSFLFNEEGSYSIECSIEDTNGNKVSSIKKEFVRIRSSIDIIKIRSIWQ